MKPRALLLLTALALVAAVPAAANQSVRTLNVNLTASDASVLDVEVPVGEIHVEGTSGAAVQVQVDIQCAQPVQGGCKEAASRIELSSSTSRDRLTVELDGWPRGKNQDGLTAAVRIQMPSSLSLAADLGVGEFEAVGLEADLTLDLGVGEASIRGRERQVRHVDLEVGVGEANLRVGERHFEGKGFIGRDLSWRNERGQAAVKVDCGVGEVNVRLDD